MIIDYDNLILKEKREDVRAASLILMERSHSMSDHCSHLKNFFFKTYIFILYSCLEKEPSMSRSGLLMAEPFSWRSVLCQLPVLKIQTTATKAALLSLPPG